MLKSVSKEKSVELLLFLVATSCILIIALIFLFLLKEAAPLIFEPGIGELFASKWVPVSFIKEYFGLLPLIAGSFLVTFIAIIISVPIGVCSAIYLSEIATNAERELFKPVIEILAGIPSVVFGFFGLTVVSGLVKDTFSLSSGQNAFTGALVLALMAAPTIISLSEDAIRSVPKSYKEASLALGANRLQTIFLVTVPAALSGMIAAVILGVGRVIGETMAVMMVTGNAPIIAFSPFESVRTMTATIAAEMGEAPAGSAHYHALFWVGVVLLVATFMLNVIAKWTITRFGIKRN